MQCPTHLPRAPRWRVRGISLIFSLITLAALSLAAVALIRSVDTGATILGNLSFQQDTVMAADEATRQAVVALDNFRIAGNLEGDLLTRGYVSHAIDGLDPTGASSDATRAVIDWDGKDTCDSYKAGTFANCFQSAEANMPGGVRARYLIVRLCSDTGNPNAVSCARPLKATATSSTVKDLIKSAGGKRIEVSALSQYFRVIVRAQGGRKAVVYTETLVHF